MALQVNKQISDNCTITHIDENNIQDSIVITVILYITFYGKECEAYVVLEDLDKEEASYGMIESDTEIHASLCNILESETAWIAIKESVKEYLNYLNEIEQLYN